MITDIARNSAREGRSWSRLPKFPQNWIDLIRGSADFLGLNYYTSRYVQEAEEPKASHPSYEGDRNLKDIIKPHWKRAASNWLYSVPQGLADILKYLIVTVNG